MNYPNSDRQHMTDHTQGLPAAASSPTPCARVSTEQMKSELIAAGWTQQSMTVWVAPNGSLYRGPHGAWKAMNGILIGSGAPTPEAIISDMNAAGRHNPATCQHCRHERGEPNAFRDNPNEDSLTEHGGPMRPKAA